MTDRIPAHERMTKLASQPDTTPDNPAVTAARSTVDLARGRLLDVRRRFVRRDAGAADVARAEHALSAALDQLDHAAGTGWRT